MTTAVNLVRSFRHLRALVIGDAMLDTFLEGTATRLCREGPVPVVRKTAELYAPGGAANTAANLRALDADEVLPEAEAAREVGGHIEILPLAGSISTSSVIDRIIALAADERIEVEQ
jgi:bifunctional ADP-heptose synthase (sugar kinase/adenylyltransferase)